MSQCRDAAPVLELLMGENHLSDVSVTVVGRKTGQGQSVFSQYPMDAVKPAEACAVLYHGYERDFRPSRLGHVADPRPEDELT